MSMKERRAAQAARAVWQAEQLKDNTPRTFYLAFSGRYRGTLKVVRYSYDPGGYPQFDATFADWRERCIRFAKENGNRFRFQATEAEYDEWWNKNHAAAKAA